MKSSLVLEVLQSHKDEDAKQRADVQQYEAIASRLMAQRKFEAATAVAERLTLSYPRALQAYQLLAGVQDASGQTLESLRSLDMALFIDPDNEAVQRARKELLVSAINESLALEQAARARLWLWSEGDEPHRDDIKVPYRLEMKAPYRVLTDRESYAGELFMLAAPLAACPTYEDALFGRYGICPHCLSESSGYTPLYSCPVGGSSCPFKFCSFDCVSDNLPRHELECQFLKDHIMLVAKKSGLPASFIWLCLRVLISESITYATVPRFSAGFEQLLTLEDVSEIRSDVYVSMTKFIRMLEDIVGVPQLLGFDSVELVKLCITILDYHLEVCVYSENVAMAEGMLVATTSAWILVPRIVDKVKHSCKASAAITFEQQSGLVLVRMLDAFERGTPVVVDYRADQLAPWTSTKDTVLTPWPVLSCSCSECRSTSQDGRFLRAYRCVRCIRGLVTCGPALDVEIILTNAIGKPLLIEGDVPGEVTMALERRFQPGAQERWVPPDAIANRLDSSDTIYFWDKCRDHKLSRDVTGRVWRCSGCLSSLSKELIDYYYRLDLKLYQTFEDAMELQFSALGHYDNDGTEGAKRSIREGKSAVVLALLNLVKSYRHVCSSNHVIMAQAGIVILGLSKNIGLSLHADGEILSLDTILNLVQHRRPNSELLQRLFSAIGTGQLTKPSEEIGQCSLDMEVVLWATLRLSSTLFGPRHAISLMARRAISRTALERQAPNSCLAIRGLSHRVSHLRLLMEVTTALNGSGQCLTEISRTLEINPLRLHHEALQKDVLPVFQVLMNGIEPGSEISNRVILSESIWLGATLVTVACLVGAIKILRWLQESGHICWSHVCQKNALGLNVFHIIAATACSDEGRKKKLGVKQIEEATILCRDCLQGSLICSDPENCGSLTEEDVDMRQSESFTQGRVNLGSQVLRIMLNMAKDKEDVEEVMRTQTSRYLGGQTAFHYAAARGSTSILALLGTTLNNRFDGVFNSEDASPLHLAALCGHAHVIDFLLRAVGANVDPRNIRGETPLHAACFSLCPRSVRVLLERGAYVGATTTYGCANVFHAVVMGLFQPSSPSYGRMTSGNYDVLSVGREVPDLHWSDAREGIKGRYPVTPIDTSVQFFTQPDSLITRIEASFLIIKILKTGMYRCPAKSRQVKNLLLVDVPSVTMQLCENTSDGHNPRALLDRLWHEFKAHREQLNHITVAADSLSGLQMETGVKWNSILNSLGALREALTPEAHEKMSAPTPIFLSEEPVDYP